MRRSSLIAEMALAYAGIVLATSLNLKVFDSWDQVSVLWESAINPLLLVGHPHMPRYLLAYPGFLLQDSLPSIGFSLYISFFFAANVVLLQIIACMLNKRRSSLVVYLGFIAVHMVMNGRGVIAWTGWLICIWVCLKIANRTVRPASQLGWIGISCWFSAVSTGVFVVVVTTFVIYIISNWRSGGGMNMSGKLTSLFAVIPIGYVLVDYFFLAIEKNVDFYGGGIQGVFNMLEHGLGVIIVDPSPISLLILLLVAIVFLLILIFLILGRRLSHLERFIALPLIGGLFGFTVLTLAIPPLLLRLHMPRKKYAKSAFEF